MISLAALARRVSGATFAQAARLVEAARRDGEREVGRDTQPADEPIRFVASDRMGLVANDLAQAEVEDGRVRIVANVLGLAGASPALPPPYSQLQLQRRRARDPGLAAFFNLFDHRVLSFFYRIAQKYSWPLLAERAGRGPRDPVKDILLALSGIGVDAQRERLDVPDGALVTLAAHLGETRRSAAGVAAILRQLTGLDLQVIEACPVWMPVPETEQTRVGGSGGGRFARLGDAIGGDDHVLGAGEGALLGAAVLDVQHHFLVDIGPLPYSALRRFVRDPGARRIISQLTMLAVGLEQRPSFRLSIRAGEIPPLRLDHEETPALLGWTTWLGCPETGDGVARDCVIPLDRKAATEKPVVAMALAG